MPHYAQINQDNVVIQVIVAAQEFIDSGAVGDPTSWIQTSYNTVAGQHATGGQPLRKNYAGIGYTYDLKRDAFIPPKPFASWILDENSCQWYSPVPMPVDGKLYFWNEQQQNWEESSTQ